MQQRSDGWWGGLVHCRDKAAWTYGLFEIRDKFGYWLSSGEIDILEHLGRADEVGDGYSTLHYANPGGNHGQTFCVANTADWTTGFHVWACLWNRTSDGRIHLRFFVDGKMYGQFDDSQWPAAPGGGQGSPFDQAFYLIFNLAVGGAWAQALEASADGKSLDIDWVKVYRVS